MGQKNFTGNAIGEGTRKKEQGEGSKEKGEATSDVKAPRGVGSIVQGAERISKGREHSVCTYRDRALGFPPSEDKRGERGGKWEQGKGNREKGFLRGGVMSHEQ